MSRSGCLADHDSIREEKLNELMKERVFHEIEVGVVSWQEEGCCYL